MNGETTEAVRAYYRMGWSLIPIRAGTKQPACRSWKQYQSQRADESRLQRWFPKNCRKGIAVVLGTVSGGLICRDFDDMTAYEAWATTYPNLADTLPTVETARPGRHVYCRGDIEQIRSASQSGSGIIHFDDGELRADGGYCLLPPSTHPSGHVYRWTVPLTDELPRLDIFEAGFLHSLPCNREDRENGDNRGGQRTTEKTEAMGGGGWERSKTGTLETEIERAIRGSLPTGPGKRNRQVFELARALKAIPALFDSLAGNLKPYVQHWHKMALPVIGTKPFEETWIDFLKGWPRVKFPKGAEPMAHIMAKAAQSEIPAIAVEKGYESKPLCLLISICRELQRATGDGPFFLSCRTAGGFIGTDHSTASRYLFLLEHDGILRVVEKGGQRTRRATRFQYLPES